MTENNITIGLLINILLLKNKFILAFSDNNKVTDNELLFLLLMTILNDKSNMTNLSKESRFSKAKTSRIIKMLVVKNLISRNFSEESDDRRIFNLKLTSKGKSLIVYYLNYFNDKIEGNINFPIEEQK